MKSIQLKNVWKQAGLIAAFGALAVVGVSMNANQPVAHAAADKDKTVQIDPAQLPLPVTGTVSAAQSGAWNVGLTGTPTVNLGANSSVKIAGNAFATPIWTSQSDNPALHTFTYVLTTPFSGAESVFHTTPVVTVPAGLRYVIEHYSVVCTLPAGGTLADVAVTVNDGNFIRDDALPHVLAVNGSISGWAGNGLTKLYADAGAVINLGAVANGTNLQSCNGEISGYAVTLP